MSQFTSQQPTVKLPPPRPPLPGGKPRDQQINIPLILVAVALGLVTVIAWNWYIVDLKHTINTDTITLYRLKVSVEPGDTLRAKDLNEIQIPSALKDTYLEDIHAVTPIEIQQRYTDPRQPTKFMQSARQGQLLTNDLLVGGAASKRIEPASGKRAITLPVASEGAPPILDPNTFVDLSAVITPRGQRTQSMLVMERVKVLAVGDRTANSADTKRVRSYNNITVEVTPDEAQQLATIQQFAAEQKFRIDIRNPADNNRKIYSEGVNPELLRALNLPVPTTPRTN
ncbi:MAG: RcpC/CpaB family pilus assembly protein [Phycisphaeraceae bacterium]